MVDVTKDEMMVLVALQETQSEKDRITAFLNDVPKRLAKLDARQQEAEQRFKEKETAVAEKRKSYKSLEQDIKSRQDNIKKSDAKLFSIKNNKEYQAVLKEIDDLKRQSTKIEDQMLEILFVVEKEEVALVEARKACDEEKAGIAEDRRQVEAERADWQRRLTELDAAGRDVQAKIAP
ncbi:MAG: zinc ribbon domain-containing protein, partial [Thermodesulfobacteriota bacterium]